ncbi:MAG: type II secretion system F family protein [Clostridia bacterium]|nr:type II secretion system F family protein [Clostridia bacterium]
MLVFLFLIVIIFLVFLYCKSKNKYKEFFQQLEAKDYPLRESFLPMGHFLLQAVNYPYKTSYDLGLYNKLAELYGYKEARYYLQVSWANKLGYFLLGLLLLSFLLTARGEVDLMMSVFSVVVLIAVFFAPDYELKKKIAQRNLFMRLDFPGFLNKLTLLINAGMTITKAWEKIVLNNQKQTPFYEEVAAVMQDIHRGKPEFQAFEDFARRCRVPEITRFTAVVLQNMKKGSSELVPILRLQANACWEMRKNAAKRLGEEASTKLLLPMMLMFIAILLITATPAILALRGL